jgi:hypothetical protein
MFKRFWWILVAAIVASCLTGCAPKEEENGAAPGAQNGAMDQTGDTGPEPGGDLGGPPDTGQAPSDTTAPETGDEGSPGEPVPGGDATTGN